jgi:hypothetical protein
MMTTCLGLGKDSNDVNADDGGEGEDFLRLRPFSPDECIMTGSLIEWHNVNVAIVLLGRARKTCV